MQKSTADVGADIIRPRATNSRPYEFYRRFFVFCNTSFASFTFAGDVLK